MADIAEIRTYLASYPDDHQQRWRLARKLYEGGDYASALEELLRVREAWPDHLPLQRYIGATHYRLGQFAEAASVLERAVARNPGDVLLLEQLAKTYEGAGRRHKAIDTWKLVLKFDASPRAIEALERLGVGPNTPPPGAQASTLQELSTHGDDTLVNCPHCGEPNDMFSERCWQCHGDFSVTPLSVAPGAAPPTPTLVAARPRWRWAALALLVALGAAVAGIYDALSATFTAGRWLILLGGLPCAAVAFVVVIALSRRRANASPASAAPLAPPESSQWQGWRRFKVRKRIVEDGAGRYVSVLLSPENRRRLPDFLPGQTVDVRFEAPDPAHPQRMRDCILTFPLADSANGRAYRILVERPEGAGDDDPAAWLATHLKKDDRVELTMPAGENTMDPNGHTPLVVVSCGAGIAPAIALCNALLDQKSTRPVTFLHFMDSEAELILLPNFEFAASHLPEGRIELCFATTMPEGMVDGATSGDGVVYRKAGLSTAFLRKSANLAESQFFLCGPAPELDSLAADLGALDVPPERIVRAGLAAD